MCFSIGINGVGIFVYLGTVHYLFRKRYGKDQSQWAGATDVTRCPREGRGSGRWRLREISIEIHDSMHL